MPEEKLVIRCPDDWHVHLRDGDLLAAVAGHTARQFRRAIVMPNLAPPITTVKQALAYRGRILAALPPETPFEPLLTAYLTDDISAAEIAAGFAEGVLTACKLYPAHATTNSDRGVTSINLIAPVLETMQRIDMPLLIHGEVTSPSVDVFDREAVFVETVLQPLLRDFPGLRVVLEHVTTQDAVDFVRSEGPKLAATITPHHLEINRNAMFDGGLRPHMYCLPTAKRERHRLALRAAATSGNPKFFLGTDSAPHHDRGQGVGLRLCRYFQCTLRAGVLCKGIRGGKCAAPARRLCRGVWTGFLSPAPQRVPGSAGTAARRGARAPAGRQRDPAAVSRGRDACLAFRRPGMSPAPIVRGDAPGIERALAALQRGAVVGLPTETVYGLAADAGNAAAIAAIYTIKGRPAFNPLIAHVASVELARREGQLDERGEALAAAFWPGPTDAGRSGGRGWTHLRAGACGPGNDCAACSVPSADPPAVAGNERSACGALGKSVGPPQPDARHRRGRGAG
jgi:dihydroorotase